MWTRGSSGRSSLSMRITRLKTVWMEEASLKSSSRFSLRPSSIQTSPSSARRPTIVRHIQTYSVQWMTPISGSFSSSLELSLARLCTRVCSLRFDLQSFSCFASYQSQTNSTTWNRSIRKCIRTCYMLSTTMGMLKTWDWLWQQQLTHSEWHKK